jgi:hypothetical protein
MQILQIPDLMITLRLFAMYERRMGIGVHISDIRESEGPLCVIFSGYDRLKESLARQSVVLVEYVDDLSLDCEGEGHSLAIPEALNAINDREGADREGDLVVVGIEAARFHKHLDDIAILEAEGLLQFRVHVRPPRQERPSPTSFQVLHGHRHPK